MSNLHILENKCLRVCVADAGAELCSVIDRKSGAERIWTADPAVWNRHAPILFPFVGKVTGGTYRIGKQTYPMKTQHGFARDRSFTCIAASETDVTHLLCASDDTRAIYPYEFKLLVRHTLDPDLPRRLHVRWTVENMGSEPMYFAIGGHPGFLPPAFVRKEDCRLAFLGAKDLQHFGVTAAGFARPDTRDSVQLQSGTVPYDDSLADTWIFDDGQVDAVSLCRPDGTPYVTLHCERFPFLAVWSKKDAPFVCLEPWYGRTDDDGFMGSIDQKPGEQMLLGGEAREFAYAIDFLE